MWQLALRHKLAKIKAKWSHEPIHENLLCAWHASDLSLKQNWQHTPFLVVDLETSSLSANKGEILSIGWVPIHQGRIRLQQAKHVFIQNAQSVGDSAIIHQIRDCQLEDGASLANALDAFLLAAQGHVLVFHHKTLDLQFLNQACLKTCRAKLYLPTVDTLALEKKHLDFIGQPIQKGDLTLSQSRTRYGLPHFPAHNALTDAIATAELLLAIIAHKGDHVTLGQLLS